MKGVDLMTGIYCITNKINGKSYVGQSVNIEQRWKAHRTRPFNKNSSQYESSFYRAIRKYGLNNFIFSVLEECEQQELDNRECFWIDKLNSFKNGYNLTTGGQNTRTNSKLTELEVQEIKSLLLNSNLTEMEISDMFEVSQRTISSINLGQTWCEEQLTYPLMKNRIIEHKYFCIDCGDRITGNGIRCVKCAHLAQRVTIRPNREELKDLIRNNSFLSIGRKYGVSDNAIKKWCKSESLPHKKSDIKNFSDSEWEKI